MDNTALDEISARLAQSPRPQTFLATLDELGAPQVRPVTVMHHRGRFYFATARASRKASQITKDKRVEFVTPFSDGKHTGYLRVQGSAKEVRDLPLVSLVTTKCEYPVREYWKGVEDPDFFFFQVIPDRVEFMKPGDESAVEVTNEFV
jgi:general stress protein 26